MDSEGSAIKLYVYYEVLDDWLPVKVNSEGVLEVTF